MSGVSAVLRLFAVSCLSILCSACTALEPPGQPEPHPANFNPAERSPDEEAHSRGKFVLVDLSAFELTAFENGEPVLRSRVIVGRPGSRTPEMNSPLIAVRFNPAWSPTPSMIRTEHARYMPPGPDNPLGRILFEIQNDQLIYLHDTNDRSLFEHDNRALSHGCVRVEQARRLASWVLDVPMATIDDLVASGSTIVVPLPRAIPVSLVRAVDPRKVQGAFAIEAARSRSIDEQRGARPGSRDCASFRRDEHALGPSAE